MDYYAHNIRDYRKDTSHLTLLEHGIYRQLLDTYYCDEIPLTNDIAKLMRSHSVRNADEMQAFQNVLTDFFELTEVGYIHVRCDKVIANFHGKSAKARESANARWGRRNKGLVNSQSERNANAKRTVCDTDAIHKPNKPNKPNKETSASADVVAVFDYWKSVMDSPKSKLDKKRQKLIAEALNGYSVEDLKKAVDGCKSSEWHMGKNDRNTKFNGVDLIFRDAEKIDFFMGKVSSEPVNEHILRMRRDGLLPQEAA